MKRAVARLIAWALRLKAVRAFLHYSEHRGPQLADSITYRALFSVFAAVLLGFTVAAAWLAGNDRVRQVLITGVDATIPGLIGDGGVIDPAQLAAPAALTLAGAASLIGLVGASIGAISSTRSALRVLADRTHDDVFWLWVLLRNLGLAIAIAVGIAVSSAVTFLGTQLIDLVGGWAGSAVAGFAATVLSVIVVFVLDAALIALLFVALAGLKAPARAIVPGAIIGGVGLIVLQELSSLFVRGASSNPLLASFASLIALLLWFNLSAQVMLIACSYIVVGVRERDDRVRERFGASTFAQRRVHNAEDAVALATEQLERARAAVKNP